MNSSNLQATLNLLLRRLYAEGLFVGAQIAVHQGSAELVSMQCGTMGASDPRPVEPNSLFNAFSVTKPVVALALLQLVDQGLVAVSDKVSRHWPAFAANVQLLVFLPYSLSLTMI